MTNLAQIFRDAAVTIKGIFDDADGPVLEDITHEPFLSIDGDGKVTYDTAITIRGHVERKSTLLAWRIGRELIEAHLIHIPENLATQIGMKDRLTLSDGTSLPILEIVGDRDPEGGTFYCQILCGRPEKGVSVT
jgi:hypothetical protein